VDDRALMMAFEMFNGTLESYRQEWKEARRKQDSDRKAGRSGVNPYHNLLAGMGLPIPGHG
jgi:hypothetical protein